MLRRAMGKKKPEEMAKQREIFMSGATERGVAEHTATRIFDLMEKFAAYGFNKSHSAAYAVLAYQTAYLKAHYPVEFRAASMTLDMNNTDKLNDFRQDAKRLGIEMPVTENVYQVLEGNRTPQECVADLMGRSPKKERH